MSYWEAWSLWWSGQKLDGMTMGGLPILWWGRIGKLLQFVGGLAVVLDLLGETRLRRLASKVEPKAKSVRDIFWPSELKNPFIILLWLTSILLFVSLAAAAINALVPDNFLVASTVNQSETARKLLRPPQPPHAARAGLIAMMAVPFGFLPGLAFRYAHTVPLALAWLFRDRPSHPARWFAFVLAVIGFHLDLLGS